MTDSMNLTRIIQEVQPDEIYNLAAMSHVAYHLKLLNMLQMLMVQEHLEFLEAVKLLDLTEKTKIYQATTSELYGKVQEVHKEKQLHFIQEVLMQLQKCMLTG